MCKKKVVRDLGRNRTASTIRKKVLHPSSTPHPLKKVAPGYRGVEALK